MASLAKSNEQPQETRITHIKHPGGRPPKYTPALIKKAYEYIEVWETLGDEIPSHVAFANYLGISSTYMYKIAGHDDKKEFREILRTIKDMQHRELLSKGLNNTFNAAITKLALGKHGYHDKVEQSGSGGVTVNISRDVISVDMSIEGQAERQKLQLGEEDD